jgi:hypothetical protein
LGDFWEVGWFRLEIVGLLVEGDTAQCKNRKKSNFFIQWFLGTKSKIAIFKIVNGAVFLKFRPIVRAFREFHKKISSFQEAFDPILHNFDT